MNKQPMDVGDAPTSPRAGANAPLFGEDIGTWSKVIGRSGAKAEKG